MQNLESIGYEALYWVAGLFVAFILIAGAFTLAKYLCRFDEIDTPEGLQAVRTLILVLLPAALVYVYVGRYLYAWVARADPGPGGAFLMVIFGIILGLLAIALVLPAILKARGITSRRRWCVSITTALMVVLIPAILLLLSRLLR